MRLVTIGLAALAITLSAPAWAQGNLLDKGLEGLRGLGGSGPDSGPESGAASGTGSGLSSGEISGGLREALKVGVERVVATLGRKDGFLANPDVRIPLPPALDRMHAALARVGMGEMGKDLEERLNRAAESAVPTGKAVFYKAIEEMTLDDARQILNGPKDSATRYFRAKMAAPLAGEMRPIVDRQLAEVGAVQTYEKMTAHYRTLPFVPDVKGDLTQYALEKTVDGVFLYLGREEAAIRENPARRTTDLLKKVFAR